MTRDEAPTASTPSSAIKWKALLGLVIVWVATLTGQVWVWAMLFVWWAVVDMFYGETHFFERVERATNPLTYWTIVASWIGLSVAWVVWA